MTVTLDAIGNHLWQSTVFALTLALISLGLRQYRASTRNTLWVIASLKFLVPFAALERLGRSLPLPEWMAHPPAADTTGTLGVLIEPFGAGSASFAASPAAAESISPQWIYLVAWSVGAGIVVARWMARWIALRRIVASARPIAGEWGVSIRVCDEPIEPGVFGVFRPVVLLSAAVVGGLSSLQLTSVIAHEKCHIERRDNLFMALHMVVEAIYWFHPLVWWIEHRLVAERERACDEQVIHRGQDAGTYAAAILKVCELVLSPSLPCMARVTGVSLHRRIEAIMTHRPVKAFKRWQRGLLVAGSVSVILTPIVTGVSVAARHRALDQFAPPASASRWTGTWQMNMAQSKVPDPSGRMVTSNFYSDGFYTIEIAIVADGLRVTHLSKYGTSAQPLRQDILVSFDGRPVADPVVPQRTWSFQRGGENAFDVIRTTRQADGATQVVAQHYEFTDDARTLTWTWRAANPAPAWRIAMLVFDKAT